MIELTIILLVPIALAVVVVTMSRPATVAVTSDGGSDVRDVLVHRFIERSQRFRRGGAIVALLAAMAYLVALESVDRSGVNLNLLVFASIGLAGSIGGSILAEAFRVRHRRRGRGSPPSTCETPMPTGTVPPICESGCWWPSPWRAWSGR